MKIIEPSELREQNPDMYQELIDYYGDGEWTKDEIYIHDNLEEYAYYELTEGWYSEMGLDDSMGGAPNLIYYIDLDRLGTDLRHTWDEGFNTILKDGTVVQTPVGW